MPEDAYLMGHAYDTAVVITARTLESAQYKLNQVMRQVSSWISEHGLLLPLSETEIVMLTKRRAPLLFPTAADCEVVQSKMAVKYLGIKLDSRLTFGDYIRWACEKAAKLTASLNRFMAN